MPEIHELTNGRYKLRLTPRGAGQSFLDWIALNRWTGDWIEDRGGFLVCLRDPASGRLWNAASDEAGITRADGELVLSREQDEIATELRVSVHPTDDVERRVLRITNHASTPRRVEITSCVEVALAHPAGDLAHPAFSKLFVQTALDASCGALVATRRPRGAGERWPAMFHAMEGAPVVAWETDRLRFIGRGRGLRNPAMEMRGTTGNVLDPLLSLRAVVELRRGESREIAFILGAVEDHARIPELARKHAPGARVEPRLDHAEHEVLPHASGALDETGKQFRITLPWHGGVLALPPMPWCNVIANERFGFLVSERGAACTWSRNSQANRLTPWSNDPVCDPHGEALYLRDEASGRFWSPLPGPCPTETGHAVTHGRGFSTWSVTAHGFEHETTAFVAVDDPVKITIVRLKNTTGTERRVSLFAYHRLVLGTLPRGAGSVRTWLEREGVLCARRADESEFGDGITFCRGLFHGCEPVAAGHTCSRESFLGAGDVESPAALTAARLDGRAGDGLDPCLALAWEVVIPPHAEARCAIVLGEAVGEPELEALLARHGDWSAVEPALEAARDFWDRSLDRLKVTTPSPEIDLLVNGWMAYQALACRVRGRTAFYQSSGALGFRDQLQDAGNLTLLWPSLTREQILLHARHQFEEGDVLHWWHPEPVGRGVRTRFSDDLLWLPRVAVDYVRATGDAALWDESVPFLRAPVLRPGEEENYLKPATSDESASLFEHCCRAIDRSLAGGAHGLPLMGTGDWNDGMNRVGREGRGESVWLGFFLFEILGDFTALAGTRGEPGRAARYEARRAALHHALEGAGWDGRWYRRAYYDDGTPLGTADAAECRVDGLAQSWAVLSGAAGAARAEQAMREAARQLVSEEDGLIRLLTPPFENTPDDPGYIKGYVAGVRENGGQYTHAACWMVRAMARLGWRDHAARSLAMLSPLSRARESGDIARYKVEPYVIAADVYGAPPHIGRGGWTWYTGSAGWAFRVAIESVLGLCIEGGATLVLRPCVPDEWPEYRIRYVTPDAGRSIGIVVTNPRRCAAAIVSARLDGVPVMPSGAEVRVPLEAGEHELLVTLGPADGAA